MARTRSSGPRSPRLLFVWSVLNIWQPGFRRLLAPCPPAVASGPSLSCFSAVSLLKNVSSAPSSFSWLQVPPWKKVPVGPTRESAGSEQRQPLPAPPGTGGRSAAEAQLHRPRWSFGETENRGHLGPFLRWGHSDDLPSPAFSCTDTETHEALCSCGRFRPLVF